MYMAQCHKKAFKPALIEDNCNYFNAQGTKE